MKKKLIHETRHSWQQFSTKKNTFPGILYWCLLRKKNMNYENRLKSLNMYINVFPHFRTKVTSDFTSFFPEISQSWQIYTRIKFTKRVSINIFVLRTSALRHIEKLDFSTFIILMLTQLIKFCQMLQKKNWK